jgi:hypothetical protein
VNRRGRRAQAFYKYLQKTAFDYLLLFPFSLNCFLATVRRKSLYYGGEIWTLTKKGLKKRSTSIEIKLFKRTTRYTLLDHRNNGEILED